ncbi:apolipoprotein A-I [Talpa occidentalis]|uniref:apolipoprotein A-I n=1 Tax=Talpa occidentalis TaxID=50954 RepID=UPI001890154A|nr:apolipoprotein A-I [Talpa occidentalis]
MKAVVLTLAVLFLTGSQARHFMQQDVPQYSWEQVKDMIATLVESAKDGGRNGLADIDASSVGKHLNLHLADHWDTLSTTLSKLREQINPATKDLFDKLEKDAAGLKQALDKDVELVRVKVQPYLDDFQSSVQAELDLYRQKVAPLTEEYREKARQKLQELQEKLAPFNAKLREGVRAHVDALRASVAPYSEEARQMLASRLEELKKEGLGEYPAKAAEHLKAFGEKAKPALENVRQDLQPLFESLKAAFLTAVEDAQKQLSAA